MVRPINAADSGGSVQIATVIRSELKRKLIAAAARNGRTLSGEIGYRLELSFRDEWLVRRILEAARGR